MARALTPPDPPLETASLRLRPFRRDDAPAIVAAGSDAAIIEHTFMPAAPTPEVVEGWLARAAAGWELGLARFAVVARDDPAERCLGQAGLFLVDNPAGNAEAAYWLLPEARGHGWASAALDLLAEWAFRALEVERLAVFIDLDNPASQRTAEHAGFTREGVLRSYSTSPRRGRLDLWCFSRLPSDPAPADVT